MIILFVDHFRDEMPINWSENIASFGLYRLCSLIVECILGIARLPVCMVNMMNDDVSTQLVSSTVKSYTPGIT